MEALVEFRHEGPKVDLQGLEPSTKLDDIKTANASLGPADDRLSTAQPGVSSDIENWPPDDIQN